MGTVWLADHLALGKPVAVKVLAPQYAGIDEVVTRFRQEARSAARVRSENVVSVLDCADTEDGRPYIVMEFLEGEDLETALVRRGALPLEETRQIVEQCARALTRAHALGIVHRDIKPHNIFLTRKDDGSLLVKVVDFGIAKETADVAPRVTQTQATMGTPNYMSPEQVVSAKTVDHRTDLWSLAVVAYNCLTSRVPFDGETFGAICIAIHRGEFTPPSHCRSDLGPAVDDFFRRAFQPEIDQRFASAAELEAEFTRACVEAMREADLAWDTTLAAPIDLRIDRRRSDASHPGARRPAEGRTPTSDAFLAGPADENAPPDRSLAEVVEATARAHTRQRRARAVAAAVAFVGLTSLGAFAATKYTPAAGVRSVFGGGPEHADERRATPLERGAEGAEDDVHRALGAAEGRTAALAPQDDALALDRAGASSATEPLTDDASVAPESESEAAASARAGSPENSSQPSLQFPPLRRGPHDDAAAEMDGATNAAKRAEGDEDDPKAKRAAETRRGVRRGAREPKAPVAPLPAPKASAPKREAPPPSPPPIVRDAPWPAPVPRAAPEADREPPPVPFNPPPVPSADRPAPSDEPRRDAPTSDPELDEYAH